MTDFRFLPPAEEEMIGESLFYQAVSSELGPDFLDDVQPLEQPKLRRPVGHGMRRALLSRFPFSLICAEQSDAILIVAVAHHKRRPDYWRKRSHR